MLRPDESHSLVSARAKAVRSATCSPSMSITRRVCPAFNSNAVPVCGSRRDFVIIMTVAASLFQTPPGSSFRSRFAQRRGYRSVPERTLADGPRISRCKRRRPIFFDRAAGVLPRFARFAEVAQHRIHTALQLHVALSDGVLHALPLSVGAKSLELLVRIEHERRPAELARHPRAVRVQADDVKRLPAEAERKLRVGRIGLRARVPG